MAQKYLCPHCKKEVSETDIMGGLCPSCHRLFIKPLSADNFPGEFRTTQNPSQPVYTPQKTSKVDLTKEFDNSDVVGKTCPYCQTPIKPGASTVICPKCNIPHHKECWEENGGCTTYGCQYANSLRPQRTAASDILVKDQSSNTSEQNAEVSMPFRIWKGIVGFVVGFVILIIIGIWFSAGQHNDELQAKSSRLEKQRIKARKQQNDELQAKLNSCPSKSGIFIKCYYESLFDEDIIMFDFLDVNGSVRRIDPIHLLLQFGNKITSINYKVLVLANNGEKIFMITKTSLSELSYEYTYGNPIWSLMHLPESLMLPDGSQAFPTWTGGILGVTAKQTEDLIFVISKWIEKY